MANPETGEVERVETGEQRLLPADTWHHAFAHGPEPLRVLELFAPPPAAGAVGRLRAARGRTSRPARYAGRRACSASGRPAPAPPARGRCTPMHPGATSCWRRDVGALVRAPGQHRAPDRRHARASLPGRGRSPARARRRRGAACALDGPLHVRAWHEDAVHVFELEAEDACYLPAGCPHEYRNAGRGAGARALRDRARATCRDAGARRRDRRRRDEARRRGVSTCDAGRLAGPCARRPTLPRRGADAVLADCVALAREVAAGAPGRRGGHRPLRDRRSGGTPAHQRETIDGGSAGRVASIA